MTRTLICILAIIVSACSTTPTLKEEPAVIHADLKSENDTDHERSMPKPLTVSRITEPAPATAEAEDLLDNIEEEGLWARLERGFGLPPAPAEVTGRHVEKLLSRPELLATQIESALPYLDYVLSQVEQRGLPTELALLPFIESGYRLDAFAFSGAAGPWQIMPGTARDLNIEVNWWSDERLNLHASTHAALDYLEHLYDRYGDWNLALSAYNAGPARVQRALNRHDNEYGVSFTELKLPRETRNYVPRLYAYRDVITQLGNDEFFQSIDMNFTPLQHVQVDQQIDISVLASLTELTADEILSFNPGYRRWATSPNGQHEFVLPLESAREIEAGIAELRPEQFMPWQQYTIQNGDTLSHIAKRFGLTVSELKRINQLRSSRIIAGRTLKVPNNGSVVAISGQTPADRVHVVSNGESWWKIARRYGLTVRKLASLNQRSPKQPIFPGEEILISR